MKYTWTKFHVVICEVCNEGFDYDKYDPLTTENVDKIEAHTKETGHAIYRIEKKLLLS